MDRDFATIVKLGEKTIPGQQIIFNGEVVQQESIHLQCIACPNCGTILYEYPQEVSKLEALQHICENKEKFKKILKYCSQCGQKLSFESFEVVEVTNE